MNISGVKGNDGKAVSLKMTTQFLFVFVIASVAIAAVKTFGTASWHASATMDDHSLRRQARVTDQNSTIVADISAAKEADKDIQDKNLIKFVFSSLDGEKDHEGDVVVKLYPEWAPIGVTRIKELTADSFWDGCRAFRVVPNFVVQLGISGDPKIQRKWNKNIADDPVKASNTRGTVTFAMAGKGTRTTQIFFNKRDNSRLDKMDFSPFGEVISGMEIIDRIYAEYEEGPNQSFIEKKGNDYLEKKFPKLSFIKSARFVSETEMKD